MPGQINKALAKTIGSAIDPFFPSLPPSHPPPPRERERKRVKARVKRGGEGADRRKRGQRKRERERGRKNRETSLISIPQPWTKR